MRSTWKKAALALGASGGLMLQTTCSAELNQALMEAAIAGVAAAVENAINDIVTDNLPPDEDN